MEVEWANEKKRFVLCPRKEEALGGITSRLGASYGSYGRCYASLVQETRIRKRGYPASEHGSLLDLIRSLGTHRTRVRKIFGEWKWKVVTKSRLVLFGATNGRTNEQTNERTAFPDDGRGGGVGFRVGP